MRDDELLAALGEALESAADLVQTVAAEGRSAFGRRRTGGQLRLAVLVHDSAHDRQTALRHSSSLEPLPARTLVFQVSPDSDSNSDSDSDSNSETDTQTEGALHDTSVAYVEVEVDANRLVGQLLPAVPAAITLETLAGAEARTGADEAGFFILPLSARGPMRLRCTDGTGGLRTDWFLP